MTLSRDEAAHANRVFDAYESSPGLGLTRAEYGFAVVELVGYKPPKVGPRSSAPRSGQWLLVDGRRRHNSREERDSK